MTKLSRFIRRSAYFSIRRPSSIWLESYWWLKLTCPVKLPLGEGRTISVAIPHFNGAGLAHVSLFHILDDPRVAEIVVLDDGSDAEEFERLRAKLGPFAQKVKLFRRDANWGAFANKIQAVELCGSEWVVLLDYDNTLLPEYLQSMFEIPDWKESTIYCPGFAYPNFDFRESLGGKEIDLEMASSMAGSDDFNGAFFNAGNYLLHRSSFLRSVKPSWACKVSAADVIFANYLWLSSGNTLRVLRGARYLHRVHRGSTWLKNREESKRVLEPIVKRLRTRRDPSGEGLAEDFHQYSGEWVEPARISLQDD